MQNTTHTYKNYFNIFCFLKFMKKEVGLSIMATIIDFDLDEDWYSFYFHDF